MYSRKNRQYWYNQHFRDKDWVLMNTHQNLHDEKDAVIYTQNQSRLSSQGLSSKREFSSFKLIMFKNIFGFNYLYKTFHLHRILVYKYSCKNRQCWCNQRSRHTDWNPQNTHRYLM